MKRRAHKRSARLACGLLMGVLAGLSALTWRAWRQETWDMHLVEAVRYNDTEKVVALLRQGADPNTRSEGAVSTSFWHWLSTYTQTLARPPHAPHTMRSLPVLVRALQAHVLTPDSSLDFHACTPQIIRALVEAGADPNPADVEGMNAPLMNAVFNEPLETVGLLLKHKANVNTTGARGWTPLRVAVRRQDTAQVRLLLRYGANVQAKDQQGTALLALAKQYHDAALIHILEQAGATQ
jgi:hypothetical protein